jgi:hypothetical protein
VKRGNKRAKCDSKGCRCGTLQKDWGFQKSSLSLWVGDIELTEEQIEKLKQNQRRYIAQHKGGRTNREKFRQRRIAYQEAGRAKAREHRPLHLIGCVLYWAEGAKDRNALYFVNSDPNMLLLFMRFLRDELLVTESDITIYIQCHAIDPMEIARLETYWIDLLCLPRTCLRKTHVKKGSDFRKTVLRNGVCGINVGSTELVQHIYGAIQEYGGFENPDWLF